MISGAFPWTRKLATGTAQQLLVDSPRDYLAIEVLGPGKAWVARFQDQATAHRGYELLPGDKIVARVAGAARGAWFAATDQDDTLVQISETPDAELIRGGSRLALEWEEAVQTGTAFARHVVHPNIVARFSYIQLWNPAGSGVDVIAFLTLIMFLGNVQHSLRTHATALATLEGLGRNLLAGGAGSIAEIRREDRAALTGTEFARILETTNVTFKYPTPWVVVLPPGQSMLIGSEPVNNSVQGTFLWMERTSIIG